MKTNRRSFLVGAAGLGFGGLALYLTTPRLFGSQKPHEYGYGPLISDPGEIIDLPAGFSYKIIARTGEAMSDGLLTPGQPDGMAAFPGENGAIILIKNHELWPNENDIGPFGEDHHLLSEDIKARMFDPGEQDWRSEGGTTTLIYDPASERVIRQFLSLAGTNNNCAGGPTPWNSWLSCEETFSNAGDGLNQDHGYVFEVPASMTPGLAPPIPLKDMGKFAHEATATDPRTGIVYQTEDDAESLIYRYIPYTPGKLADGGRLQALAIAGSPSTDTRNWGDGPIINQGDRLATTWVDLNNVDAHENDLRLRGFADGAARFARGEGMWFGDGRLYFACTSGGPGQNGQIWRYRPSENEGTSGENGAPGTLELYAEPRDDQIMRNCDNITFAPHGHLIICEDATGSDFIRGIDPDGRIYTLAHNPYSFSEFAGACFSPDGQIMFVNMQDAQLTLAIKGPWARYSPQP
jgi:uncharacterized protein